MPNDSNYCEYSVTITGDLFFGTFRIVNGIVKSTPVGYAGFKDDYLTKMILGLSKHDSGLLIVTHTTDDKQTMCMSDVVESYNSKV